MIQVWRISAVFVAFPVCKKLMEYALCLPYTKKRLQTKIRMSIATTNDTLNGFALTIEHDVAGQKVVIRLTDEGKQWTSTHTATDYTQCTEKGCEIGGFSNFVAILKLPTDVSRVGEGEYAIVWGKIGDIYFPLHIKMHRVKDVAKNVNRTRPSSPSEDFHMVDKPETNVPKPLDANDSHKLYMESQYVVHSPFLNSVVLPANDLASGFQILNNPIAITSLGLPDSIPVGVLQGMCKNSLYVVKKGDPCDLNTIVKPFLDAVVMPSQPVVEEKCNVNEERPLPTSNVVDSLWGKLFGKKDEEKIVKVDCPVEIPTAVCPISNSAVDVPVPVAKPTYTIEFGKKAKYFGFADGFTSISNMDYETAKNALKPLTDENPLFTVDYLAKHFSNGVGIIDLDMVAKTDEQKFVCKAINKIAFDLYVKELKAKA